MREIKKFWYITSINNLVSIFKRGILCRAEINKAEINKFEIPTTDISNRGVQKHRKGFHQLVPLFFADNTPMLYIKMKEASDAICLLEIDKAVKDLDDVIAQKEEINSFYFNPEIVYHKELGKSSVAFLVMNEKRYTFYFDPDNNTFAPVASDFFWVSLEEMKYREMKEGGIGFEVWNFVKDRIE